MKFEHYDDKILREQLSGDRFSATYRIRGSEQEAMEKAGKLCVEQTVEFPAEHIDCPAIQDGIIGKVESLTDAGGGWYRAVISYADETVGEDFPQFLNVLFGNSSILPDITLERVDVSKRLRELFPGPRYGVEGLRKELGVRGRPFLFSAIKPMGLPPEAFAETAYRLALGGIDLIKDDHGLMDQSFAPYRERVKAVAAAVDRANRETGGHTAYIPNVSGSSRELADRIRFAQDAGARGVMLAPGLTGFDAVYQASRSTDLIVVGHPAWIGASIDKGGGGIDCACLIGQLPRLAGADISIFPNFGGRFSFTRQQCAQIRDMAAEKLEGIRAMVPCPAGGMSVERAGELRQFYGDDAALLIGGSLLTQPGSLTENCRKLKEALGPETAGDL